MHKVWKLNVPPNCTFFLWKLFHGALPVDCRIRNKGIYITSMCNCCKMSCESWNHIFISGPLAVKVWTHFARVFGFPILVNENPTVRLAKLMHNL